MCIRDTVWAVAVTPDGQRILSGSEDKTVRVWLLDGTLKKTFELHTGYVRTLVALPDNQHALSASFDKTVKLFNVNDGAVLRTFQFEHSGPRHVNLFASPVVCLALMPDGRRFVCGSEDASYISGCARVFEHGLAPQRAV